MNCKKFVKRQNDLFLNGYNRVTRNRREWESLSELVKITYRPVLQELESGFRFDFFYLKEGKDYCSKWQNLNQNFINLSMGSRPNGIITYGKGETGELGGTDSVEKGGQLVFSQGPQGEVLVIIYACSSNEFQYQDKYIVYRIYSSPIVSKV